LEVTCLPNDEDEADNCALIWDAEVSDDGKLIDIEVKFKTPPTVSQGEEKDSVLIQLWGAPSLKSKAGK